MKYDKEIVKETVRGSVKRLQHQEKPNKALNICHELLSALYNKIKFKMFVYF